MSDKNMNNNFTPHPMAIIKTKEGVKSNITAMSNKISESVCHIANMITECDFIADADNIASLASASRDLCSAYAEMIECCKSIT